MTIEHKTVSRVVRSKEDARKFYDRISNAYDWFGGVFERRPAVKALDYLQVRSGQSVLEIGFGTGYCLQRIATLAGCSGHVYGLDISSGMVRKARARLAKTSLLTRVELCQGDAASLPFNNQTFDAVFMSFTLELFDTPEIPRVLDEIRRVLKPGGRLGALSLSKSSEHSLAIRLYEWAHSQWPGSVDCRPIYLDGTLQRAGYHIILKDALRLLVLPVDIVIATKES